MKITARSMDKEGVSGRNDPVGRISFEAEVREEGVFLAWMFNMFFSGNLHAYHRQWIEEKEREAADRRDPPPPLGRTPSTS